MADTRSVESAPARGTPAGVDGGFLDRAIGPAGWALGALAFLVYSARMKPLDELLSPDAKVLKFASGHSQTLLWLTLEHWLILSAFGVVVLIVAGRLGRGLGLPGLFRNPPRVGEGETAQRYQRPGYRNCRGRLTALLGAFGATLLIAEIWTVIYYLEVVENLPDLSLSRFRGETKAPSILDVSLSSNHVALLWFLLRSGGPFLGLLMLAVVFPGNAPGVRLGRRHGSAEFGWFAAGVLSGAAAIALMATFGAWLHHALEVCWRGLPVPPGAVTKGLFCRRNGRFPVFKIEEMYPQLCEPAVVAAIVVSFAMFLVIVLLFYHAIALFGRRLSPGLAICMVLSFGVLFYATLAMLSTGGQVAAVGSALVWFVIANGGPYKYRFPGMDAYYRRGGHVPLKDLETLIVGPPRKFGLLRNEEVLEKWKGRIGPERPRLVLVATTGGAYRAAFWTTVVLDELGRRLGRDFHRHVRLITGASGGMVGAAYYVSAFRESGPPEGNVTDTMRDETGLDSLTPVARRLVLHDLPMGFYWPFPQSHDRGVELEREWASLGVPFEKLGAGERAGWRPSLVVSPMVVESGRRLLVSNLDLSALAETRPLSPSVQAGGDGPAGGAARVYSRSAVEFFRIFPTARPTFSLQTAIRMSATFPLASPAVSLPTVPPRRVVDAGYYDNYGVDLATSWAYEHQEWIRKNTSGMALIQIRAYPSEDDLRRYFGRAGATTSGLVEESLGRLVTSFQGLTSPLYGGLSAREWSMRFRNAAQVRVLDDTFNRDGDPEFFKSFVFENFPEFAMNWFLTDQDITCMRRSIGADECAPTGADETVCDLAMPADPVEVAKVKRMVKDKNLEVKNELAAWWAAKAQGEGVAACPGATANRA